MAFECGNRLTGGCLGEIIHTGQGAAAHNMTKTLGRSMRFLLATVIAISASSASASLWINEIHYDNDGGDTGEAVEIVVAPDMASVIPNIELTLYNGSGGLSYNTFTTFDGDFTITTEANGFTILTALTPGIQNGAPDGLALSTSGSLVEFLSYEGTFTASNGPASGVTSTNIGVAEGGSTPVGFSLQLTGSGSVGADFTWANAASSTFGAVNTGQSLIAPIPEPTAALFGSLLAAGLGMTVGRRRQTED